MAREKFGIQVEVTKYFVPKSKEALWPRRHNLLQIDPKRRFLEMLVRPDQVKSKAGHLLRRGSLLPPATHVPLFLLLLVFSRIVHAHAAKSIPGCAISSHNLR